MLSVRIVSVVKCYVEYHCADYRYGVIMVSLIMLSIALLSVRIVSIIKCRYIEYHCAEYRYTECYSAECLYS